MLRLPFIDDMLQGVDGDRVDGVYDSLKVHKGIERFADENVRTQHFIIAMKT